MALLKTTLCMLLVCDEKIQESNLARTKGMCRVVGFFLEAGL